MNGVALLIRRSADYDSGNSCIFYSNRWQKNWDIKDKVQLWNSIFSMPYFEVRKRLFEIAFGDVESLGFDLVFRNVDDDVMSKIESLSKYWVVPIDDDDWISKELPSFLAEFESEEQMCHWGAWRFDQTSISLGLPDLKIDFRLGMDMVRSCAYAVRPSIGRSVMTDHGMTRGLKGAALKDAYSFYVRTPASVAVLKYHPENGIRLVKMWEGMSRLSEDIVPIEFRSKIRLLKDLFKECRPRRSIL